MIPVCVSWSPHAFCFVSCAPNSALKYKKQTLLELKGKIEIFVITNEDFNFLLSTINSTIRQKAIKDKELINTINQKDVTDSSRSHHSKTEEYIIF
jgi:hypothetical protein